MREQANVNGWTTGRIIVASVTLVAVVLILSATAIVYGFSSTVGTAIKNNPELLSAVVAEDLDSENSVTLALLLSKYVKGGFDGNGEIDGSFTGHFTTVEVRNLEKVNLSCVDQYNYQIVTASQHPIGLSAANALIRERKFNDAGCANIGTFTKPDLFEERTANGITVKSSIIYNESFVVYRCPLNNCAVREVTAEKAGDFIPESINIKRVQAGVSSQIGK